MTVQDMINNIKDNLGNRASGTIGSKDVNVAALEAINVALPHLVQEAQPDYYNRVATISIPLVTLIEGSDGLPTTTSIGDICINVSDETVYVYYSTGWVSMLYTPASINFGRSYALPVKDTEGNTIRIKNIYATRCSRSGGSYQQLTLLNFTEFLKRVTDYDEIKSGIPSYIGLWGSTNNLHIDTIPSERLTLTLYVEVYPNVLTPADLLKTLPIDNQWNLVVEAFATQYLYLRMQQLQMHQFWMDAYLKQKQSVSRMEYQKQGNNLSGMINVVSGDPLTDPFVNRWNS